MSFLFQQLAEEARMFGRVMLKDKVEIQSGYNATGSLYATRQVRRDIERRLARDLGERIARVILARADEALA